MKDFIKTTLIGGALFMFPFAVLIIVLEKVAGITHKAVDPIANLIPIESLIGLKMPIFLTIVLMVLICFAVGLLAHTRLAARFVGALETTVLLRIPGYELLKSLGESAIGTDRTDHQVVFVRLDDAWQVGLTIEAIPATGQVVVFIPDSPTPQTGSVMIVDAERVKKTDIPLTGAMSCLTNRGLGLGKLVTA